MTEIFNWSDQRSKRKQLRNSQTFSEQKLWQKIRRKQINGFRFRRQFGIGPYVVDFYCPELLLAIEVDGDTHFQPGAEEYDQKRQKDIESLGIRVIRFTNSEVDGNLDGVIEMILQSIPTPP